MSTKRQLITQRDVERALARPADAENEGLRRLLMAATGPASVTELSGEERAVSAFAAAYRHAMPTVTPTPRGRVATRRSLMLKLVMITATLAGGAALAVQAGALPGGPYAGPRTALDRAATPTADITGYPYVGGNPSHGETSRPPDGTGTSASPVSPSEAPITDLCRAWTGNSHAAVASHAPSVERLSAAAGGAELIDAYCAKLLGQSHSPTGPPSWAPGPNAWAEHHPHNGSDPHGNAKAKAV